MSRIPFENIPENLMNCMMQTEKYIKSLNIIDESFMEVLRYRVSVINQCAYCIDMHFKEAVAASESELRIYSSSVWKETTYYTESEQALLEWAESVTLLNDTSEQRQQSFTNLSKHFSQDDISNLTLSIMQINSWNRLAKSFGFEAGTYQVGQH
ncbi:MAG: carboxymuconolactone decarboxylase family protein [Thalassolituus oleivorans]|uniref:carboxymuconolactone decarboxylase family protein n=1 Tax=Thalassolituus oleivorans TaxID=187493 RepID=UPI001B7A553A|nr:carboxymuconolactone decarboxylase family protein [Thalassolituus oleivorans]MBQ0727550.1 carboxymuconolactone decarboxylase family protein [Thalassolituus oleivorans]